MVPTWRKITRLHKRYALHTLPRTHHALPSMHRHDSEDPENWIPKIPKKQDSQILPPNRRDSRPAWEIAPHALPRTPFLALGGGGGACLLRSRR